MNEQSEESAPRILDARLHLLDRQVLDQDGEPIATLDDIELSTGEDGSVVIGSLLFGSVLLSRLTSQRPPRSRFTHVPWSAVSEIGLVITVSEKAETLDATWLERWLRDRIIARIPGADHDPR